MGRPSNMFVLALGAASLLVAPAFAQAPTAAQQQALKSNCVSDFRANCSGVPTGGMDALVCLEQHVDNLSPGCKSAVEAVDTAPAAAAPASTATAPIPTEKPADAPKAAPPAAAEAPKTEAAAPTAAAPAAPQSSPITLRQEMRIAAGACAVDFRLFCPNLPVGHGNVLFCLKVHGPRLAPACREALVKAGVSVR